MRPEHIDLPPGPAEPFTVRASKRRVVIHGAGPYAVELERGQGAMFVWQPAAQAWHHVGEEF